MSEDGLSPLEETLASYMQVLYIHSVIHYEIFELLLTDLQNILRFVAR